MLVYLRDGSASRPKTCWCISGTDLLHVPKHTGVSQGWIFFTSQNMLVYLRDGSSSRPKTCQCISGTDLLHVPKHASVSQGRIFFTSQNMPVYLVDGSASRPNNMPVYLRDGSASRPNNMPVYLRDGSASRPSNMLVYLRDGSASCPKTCWCISGTDLLHVPKHAGVSQGRICLTFQNMLVYLRDGSAQTVVCGATQRPKTWIKLAISPSHSIPVTVYQSQHTSHSIPVTAYQSQYTSHSIPVTAYQSQHTSHSTLTPGQPVLPTTCNTRHLAGEPQKVPMLTSLVGLTKSTSVDVTGVTDKKYQC